jgi:hypothetical protein
MCIMSETRENKGGRPVVGRVVEVRFGDGPLADADRVARGRRISRAEFIRQAVSEAVDSTTVTAFLLQEFGLYPEIFTDEWNLRSYSFIYGEGESRVIVSETVDVEDVGEPDDYLGWTVIRQVVEHQSGGDTPWETVESEYFSDTRLMCQHLKTTLALSSP